MWPWVISFSLFFGVGAQAGQWDAQVRAALPGGKACEMRPGSGAPSYEVTCSDSQYWVYVDQRRVRTHPQTLLVWVNEKKQISRVEVVQFDEPKQYQPKSKWYQTFEGKVLSEDLRMRRAIPWVTGASLTTTATTDAIRGVLEKHEKYLESKKP